MFATCASAPAPRQAFESLVEVSGVGKTGLQSRALFVSAMKADKVWESG